MLYQVSTIFQRWKKLLYSYLTSTIRLYHKTLGHTTIGPSSGTLSIIDNRTRRKYSISVVNNTVQAIDFLKITTAGQGADVVDHYENSIRILDRGYLNTACMESSVTFM